MITLPKIETNQPKLYLHLNEIRYTVDKCEVIFGTMALELNSFSRITEKLRRSVLRVSISGLTDQGLQDLTTYSNEAIKASIYVDESETIQIDDPSFLLVVPKTYQDKVVARVDIAFSKISIL